MQTKIEQIRSICISTRDAIIANKDKTKFFKDFPVGCCRNTSIIIGLRLQEIGIKNLKYCSKEIDEDFSSHAWLEYNDFVIDITAYQFGQEFPLVTIGNNPSNKLYKNQIKIDFNPNIAETDLLDLYQDIKILERRF